MAEITAASVKELRERTGAGMMDCKKALAENNGEMEASVDWLRAKGLAAAAKKAGRTAAEGLVGVAVEGTKGAVVEVNSETDFVAKNEQFQDFVKNVSEIVLKTGSDLEALKGAAYPTGGTVEEKLTDNIATIGENQSLRRAAVLEVSDGRRCRRFAGAWQAARDAHRRCQPAGTQRRRSRSRSPGARKGDRRRKGQRERQAG
jgi:elongation factor Ts